MALLTRKRTVLAKIETVYGDDSSPTGSANAMLVKNLNINPIQAELVSRDLIRPYLGNSEQLLAETFVQMDFEVELVGAGAIGKVPAYDSLLRACGFAKTNVTEALSAVVTSAVATVTKAAHGYVTGTKITVIDGTDPGINGEKTITVVNPSTFTYPAPGVADGAAAGAPKLVTGIEYKPVSEGFESITLYYNVDGVLHKTTGAYGNVEFNLTAKQIPVMRFQFTGLYISPEDEAAPAVDFTSFMIPELANSQNTPGFDLLGYSSCLESMSLNMNNDVQYITLIGCESVKILNRTPSGTLIFEAPTIAEKDFFTDVKNSVSGAMALDHGAKLGYKVSIDCPAVLLGNPSYQDSNGVQVLNAPFTINPVSGNDEIVLTVSQ